MPTEDSATPNIARVQPPNRREAATLIRSTIDTRAVAPEWSRSVSLLLTYSPTAPRVGTR